MIKVLLAAPSYDGRYDVRFLDSLINTIPLCEKNNIKILPYFLCYDSLIHRARNDYFHTAYTQNLDVLFFIDSDVSWNPHDFIKLVLSKKDMIGGTYRKKTEQEELYAVKIIGNTSDEWIDNLQISTDDDLLEVQGLGCGFLKISKKAIKNLYENEKEFYFIDNANKEIRKNICSCVINENNQFISEDIILGFKWKALGGQTFLDTSINLSHVGFKAYTGNVKEWLQDWRNKLKNINEILDKSTDSNLDKYFQKNENENELLDDDTFKIL